MPFICSICAEESVRICARCTKDACNNHLCERCLRCSDCCECEVALSEPIREPVRSVIRVTPDELIAVEAGGPEHEHPHVPLPDPEPEPDRPNPEPDPFPEEDPVVGPTTA
jgi:hypothetical protein